LAGLVTFADSANLTTSPQPIHIHIVPAIFYASFMSGTIWYNLTLEVGTRGGTNQYFSIIGMLGTVPDSYLFQIPVIKYLLPPHTVLVIGPALDTVQNSR
jgi:hypothetical protein